MKLIILIGIIAMLSLTACTSVERCIPDGNESQIEYRCMRAMSYGANERVGCDTQHDYYHKIFTDSCGRYNWQTVYSGENPLK